MPNPVSRVDPSAQFTRILAGLTSLWTRPRWCSLAQRGDDADGEAQEAARLHRRAEQPIERLAARILEQQHGSTAFAGKRQRPRRPCGVELVPQFIFVGEAIEDGRGRALHSRQHGQKGAAAAVAVLAPPPAEDAIPILPHDLEAVFSLSAERKRLLQLPCSAGQAARSRSTHSAQTFARDQFASHLGIGAAC